MKEGTGGFIKDLLFPVFCAGCGLEGCWLCADCERKLQPDTGNKKADAPLDGLTALFSYEEKTVSELIRSYKYGFALEIARIWEKLIKKLDLEFAGYAVMAVPLHPRRLRERGFNQSEIIAGFVAARLNLRPVRGLLRIRYTAQQARLSGDERRKNLESAFLWPSGNPAPEDILLIDDVYTTGATMQACAAELRKHGAKKIWGLVLAAG